MTVRSFAGRRRRNLMLIAVVAIAGWITLQANVASLRPPSRVTGCCLFAVVLFLSGFNVRKKLPFLPALGSAAWWMQAHIYLALLSLPLFLVHLGMRIPDGPLETALALLFSIVWSSGLYGLYITRVIPRQLANLQREVIYERIPAIRRHVSERSRQLAMSAELASPTIAAFYVDRLLAFFERPRGWFYRVWPSSRRQRQLITDIRDLQRYCSPDEQRVAWQLADLVREKEDLDYHHAQQWKLKSWLFLHVGLTYSLILVALAHAVLAEAFRGF